VNINKFWKQRSGYFSGEDKSFLLEGLWNIDKIHSKESPVPLKGVQADNGGDENA